MKGDRYCGEHTIILANSMCLQRGQGNGKGKQHYANLGRKAKSTTTPTTTPFSRSVLGPTIVCALPTELPASRANTRQRQTVMAQYNLTQHVKQHNDI